MTNDGLYHCNLEVVVLAYDSDGPVAVAHTDVLNGSNVHIHQEISVPARGSYSLRTGIRDVRSNHIGALEVSIAAIRTLPPLTILRVRTRALPEVTCCPET